MNSEKRTNYPLIQIDQHGRIPAVTMLRGIAALGVSLMHVASTIHSDTIDEVARLGGYGVQLFFIISGFIIPFVMYHDEYGVRNYGRFLLKRIIRLDPPYLFTILGIVLLSLVAQWSPHHTAPTIDVLNRNGALHLLYLVDVFGGNWLNPVFWTLAIEFQFYLMIGLLFPIMQMENKLLRISVFLILCGAPFILNDDHFVTHHLLLFLPGIVLFNYVTEKINLPAFLILITLLLIIGYFKTGMSGVLCPLVALSFILYVKRVFRPLMFLGTISYSLYLIHTPLGTDGLINYLQNYISSETAQIWLAVGALPIIVGCAWLFYRVIERPAIRLARSISYKK